MSEKRQPTPCPTCGHQRMVYGKRANATTLCRRCYNRDTAPSHVKGKPMPHQQFQSPRKEDIKRMQPKTSWWCCPREQWAEAIAEQRDRLQAIGAGVPKTQQGLGERE
jgi:ribosomal protein S14